MRIEHLCLLLAALAPTGCLVGRGTVEEPRLTIQSAEIVGNGGGGASLRVVASAYNPNPFPVSLRHAAMELDVDGLRVGQSRELVARMLPPRRPVALEIVQPLDLRETTTRTKSALVRSLARYRVRGSVDVGARDRAFDVPFRHEGVLRPAGPTVTF